MVKRIDYAALVRAVEDLQIARPQTALTVSELCQRFGVSERTLHIAFRRERDMPPATFLRTLRLERARSALLRNRADKTLIKTIALDNGFLHLGCFSAAYKSQFGELPSETASAAKQSTG